MLVKHQRQQGTQAMTDDDKPAPRPLCVVQVPTTPASFGALLRVCRPPTTAGRDSTSDD